MLPPQRYPNRTSWPIHEGLRCHHGASGAEWRQPKRPRNGPRDPKHIVAVSKRRPGSHPGAPEGRTGRGTHGTTKASPKGPQTPRTLPQSPFKDGPGGARGASRAKGDHPGDPERAQTTTVGRKTLLRRISRIRREVIPFLGGLKKVVALSSGRRVYEKSPVLVASGIPFFKALKKGSHSRTGGDFTQEVPN